MWGFQDDLQEICFRVVAGGRGETWSAKCAAADAQQTEVPLTFILFRRAYLQFISFLPLGLLVFVFEGAQVANGKVLTAGVADGLHPSPIPLPTYEVVLAAIPAESNLEGNPCFRAIVGVFSSFEEHAPLRAIAQEDPLQRSQKEVIAHGEQGCVCLGVTGPHQ